MNEQGNPATEVQRLAELERLERARRGARAALPVDLTLDERPVTPDRPPFRR